MKVIGKNCPQFAKLNTFPSFVIFVNNTLHTQTGPNWGLTGKDEPRKWMMSLGS